VGYDLLAAVSFIVLTPVVIVAFVIFWFVNARDHEALAATWRSYARARGLDFEPPGGEWPNRTAPGITWTTEAATLRLTTIGREAKVRTRLVVRPRATLLGSLVWICEEGGSGAIRTAERPAGFGERIVPPDVRRALLALRQRDRVTLAYRKGRVVVEWPGGEQSEARLDEARRAGEAIAESVVAAFCRPAVERKPAA
jgi:hypothetical protein